MTVYEDRATAVFTHQDICRLFDLDEDDLPTNNGYEAELLSDSLADTRATASRAASVKESGNGWQRETTQPTSSHAGASVVDQTSSDMDNYPMTLLETAVLTQDVREFQALANVIPWSEQPPTNLVRAIRLALALEAPLIARKLAVLGAKIYPTDQELKKIERVLAPPTTTAVPSSSKLDLKANKQWITANRENFRGKWIALHNGELLASAQTFSQLREKTGEIKGKGILVTQVT